MSKALTLARRLDAGMRARGYESGRAALLTPRVMRFTVRHYPEVAALVRQWWERRSARRLAQGATKATHGQRTWERKFDLLQRRRSALTRGLREAGKAAVPRPFSVDRKRDLRRMLTTEAAERGERLSGRQWVRARRAMAREERAG